MATLNFHSVVIAPAITALKNAHAFITKGHKHALDNKIDPNTFLTASIHPDMKDFRYQVYRFTDAIKFVPSRVNPALESITLPDDQQTFEELLARIDRTIKYLEGFKPADFEGKENDEIVIKFPGRQIKLSALDYATKWAHPNMWYVVKTRGKKPPSPREVVRLFTHSQNSRFHITTAYDILRMKGVDVGKTDFLNGAGLVTVETVEE